MRVHHIGYLVKAIDKAILSFEALGYKLTIPSTWDSSREAYICFLKNEGYCVELICPSKESPLFPLLKQYEIKCINSKEPTEKEMESIVSNKLMYIYCGHGTSLKYLSTEYIESHKINFLTFLFGCSSASSRLLSEKDSQPLSTPQLFLKQLCPFFFGFLWPVSSSDLDELTVELLNSIFIIIFSSSHS